MHAVIRTFPGSGGGQKLIDLLESRKDDVEGIMRPVKGFVSYSLIRTADGMVSVTVCQDKAGCDESSHVAKEWIGKNASDLGVSPPTVRWLAALQSFLAAPQACSRASPPTFGT